MKEYAAESQSGRFVSIIIPHLNQPEELRQCLEALRNQSNSSGEFEILVVDNGSTVLPEELIQEYPGARLIEEEEPGPGPARNKGVAESTGEILLFIDADCVAAPGWAEEAVRNLAEEASSAIVGGDVRILMANPESPTMLEAYESVFAYRQEEYIKKHGFSGTGNLGMRREVFQAVGPFPGINVAEDRVWGQRAREMGFSTRYIPEMVIYHPSRREFGVIFEKWRRHTTHDYNEGKSRPWHRFRWGLKTIAVLLSVVAHSVTLLRTPRLTGAQPRLKGILALARIRWFRARLMLGFLLRPKVQAQRMRWNR